MWCAETSYVFLFPDNVASMRGRSPFHCPATKHFSPFLIQSSKRAYILTDSKPCVQAYEKLCCGEFSDSPRVSSPLCAATKLQSGMFQAPLSSNQTSWAKTPPPVITRPVRCAPLSLEPWTLSSKQCLFMTSFKATSTFHSPTDPPDSYSVRMSRSTPYTRTPCPGYETVQKTH